MFKHAIDQAVGVISSWTPQALDWAHGAVNTFLAMPPAEMAVVSVAGVIVGPVLVVAALALLTVATMAILAPFGLVALAGAWLFGPIAEEGN